MLAPYAEERKKQVWDAVTDAASSYADSHGRVNMGNEVLCISGKS